MKKFYKLIEQLKNQNNKLSEEIKAITSSENYIEAMAVQKEIQELTNKNSELKNTLTNLNTVMGKDKEVKD